MARTRTPQSFWRTGNIEGHMELIRRQVEKSLADGELRNLAVRIVSHKYDVVDDGRGNRIPVVEGWGRYFWAPTSDVCPPKDDACELGDLWSFVVKNCRYVYDPDGTDTFATAKVSLLIGGGDCFPEGTLLLTDDYRLTPIEHLREGRRIWGRDRWSDVSGIVPKGARAITSVRLNNGSWLRLTDEHKVYIAECARHSTRSKAAPCSCALNERTLTRIAVAELEPGMVLLQPEKIDAVDGRKAFVRDAEQAWLDGAFIAEGWTDGRSTDAPSRFCISGRDGKPKEATKHRVAQWAQEHDIVARWHERYIAVNDGDLAQRFATFGRGAANKRLPSLAYTQPTLRSLLEGLLLDASRNTHGGGFTFGSTSPQLAVQVRVLARMLGMRTGWARIADHGGLGTQPIHRVTMPALDAEHKAKLLRVKEIVRVPDDRCMTWDLRTDDHFVYLPEHDVTVSNCDDSVIVFSALARAIGFSDVRGRVVSVDGSQWVHTYPVIGCPKDHPTVLVPLDCTVAGANPGWEITSAAAMRDFPMY
jgi:hypothetical protein